MNYKNEEISVGDKYLPKLSKRWWFWPLLVFETGYLFSRVLGPIGWFISLPVSLVATVIYLDYKKKHRTWVLLVLGVILLILNIPETINILTGNFYVGNGGEAPEAIGSTIGFYFGYFLFCLAGAYCIYAYFRAIKSKDGTTTKPEPDINITKATADSSDNEVLEAKISTIKLGFKSINHIQLTDEDMQNLPNNELKRYYKAGEKAMKGKR